MGVPAPPLPTPGALERVYQDSKMGTPATGPGMHVPGGLINTNNQAWPGGAPPLGGLPQPTPLDVIGDTGITPAAAFAQVRHPW